jgi:hypothetical protein
MTAAVMALSEEKRCQGIAVNIQGGVYPLAQTLPFDARDSGHYGNETGGCHTYGDIVYQENYLADLTYFNICPFIENGSSYPVNRIYENNHIIQGKSEISKAILNGAGAQ